MIRVLSVLGEDAVFTHATANPVTVRGVFFMPYQAADLGFSGVTGTNPMFAVMASAVGTIAVDDLLVRAGVTYKVRVRRPDDPSGITVLDLKRI
jgi:hypothetical protein